MSDNPINGLKRKRPFPILVVEVNQDHQLVIQYGLLAGMPGADATFVSSAEEALAYLKIARLARTDFPRLVLLTIYLSTTPISWQLLKEIRLVYPLLPVVALSSTLDESVIKQAYEFGVSSFLTKPTSLPEWVHNFQVFNEYWSNTVTLPPRQSNGWRN